MSIDFLKLKSATKAELLQIARETNTPHGESNTNNELYVNILNHVMQPEKSAQAAPKEAKEPIYVGEQELEIAIAATKERYKNLSTVYDWENNCVTFKYNDGRYRHSETVNLSCSLNKLRAKAMEVGRGPLVLPTHRQDDWERLGSNNPNNDYTNVVLG